MYKLNPGFFRYIIDYYNLPPANMLHIGDSKSDIITPKQLGIRTCWLNRRNLKWDHAVKPDFEVKSLLEILGYFRLTLKKLLDLSLDSSLRLNGLDWWFVPFLICIYLGICLEVDDE